MNNRSDAPIRQPFLRSKHVLSPDTSPTYGCRRVVGTEAAHVKTYPSGSNISSAPGIKALWTVAAIGRRRFRRPTSSLLGAVTCGMVGRHHIPYYVQVMKHRRSKTGSRSVVSEAIPNHISKPPSAIDREMTLEDPGHQLSAAIKPVTQKGARSTIPSDRMPLDFYTARTGRYLSDHYDG